MTDSTLYAKARAFPNIAFIKYWGNQDDELRIPMNSSISMNLDGLYTETSVTWLQSASTHTLTLNGELAAGGVLERVANYLDVLKVRLGIVGFAQVESLNNFPMGAGIASSASAFAALARAATSAAGLELSEKELSTVARLGSGSASRSVPAGFVVWHGGNSHESSFAESFAGTNHWDLVDVVAVLSQEHKPVGSTQGHKLAPTSALQSARVESAMERLLSCQRAIMDRDFEAFAHTVELDSNMMHAVMMTSDPALMYWEPTSIAIMKQVPIWRREGLHVCYTMDAGANVHCICIADDAEAVRARLQDMQGIQRTLLAGPGAGAHLIAS